MLDIRPISPELALIAKNECFENPERMEADVKALREWLEKSPYLKLPITDQGLVSVLRCCKYSLEKAKKKIDTGMTIRTLMPELFTELYPITKEMEELLDLGMMLSLPLETPSSPRVIMNIDGLYDPNKYSFPLVMKVNGMVNDLLYQQCDNFVIAGLVIICDLKHLTLEHLKHNSPLFVKKIAYAFQEGSPYRIKGLHFINFSPFVTKMFNFFKMFLNEKTKSRIYVHETLEDLYKFVPRKILPLSTEAKLELLKSLDRRAKNAFSIT
ncbi:retinaldehyde-binding protein 1-like [Culicoides brevitarsis]|uniref:retinaldehyde-binding protein 1-like n=1 Tax=Culicoides brevitarsis TaxID=469753 RepID=UPI00307C09D3